MLRRQAVLGKLSLANRQESPCADVERQTGDFDSARGERGEQSVGEMQPGGRRGDGAGMARVDSLVARFVRLVRAMLDVGRQRHFAVTVEIGEHVVGTLEGKPIKAAVPLEDMHLDVTVGALGDEHLDGTLEYISPKGLEEEGAVLFEIKAAVQIPEGLFVRAGSSASESRVARYSPSRPAARPRLPT